MPARDDQGEARRAREAGLKRYFTGKPCARGHICERKTCDNQCIECQKVITKARRPKRRKWEREYRLRDVEKYKAKERRQHHRNKKKRNAYCRLYNRKNYDRLREVNKAWRKANPKRFNRLTNLLRTRLRVALKGKAKKGSAVRDLGCTIEWFQAYIAARFTEGMTWENHGTVWHLDHIKPLSKFDLTKRKQLREAVHFTNIQPLLIDDHRIKTAMEK
jgi:hypothetical protein